MYDGSNERGTLVWQGEGSIAGLEGRMVALAGRSEGREEAGRGPARYQPLMPTCRGERGRGQDTTFHYTRRAREREYERNRERQR